MMGAHTQASAHAGACARVRALAGARQRAMALAGNNLASKAGDSEFYGAYAGTSGMCVSETGAPLSWALFTSWLGE